MTNDTSELAVILINYNNEDDTVVCLDSLADQTLDDFLTVVVDNGSEPGSFETVKDSHDFPMYLENDENCGFTGGNNTGIEHALDEGAEWIFLLNNDTELDPEFLDSFLAAANNLPGDAGVVGPKIHTCKTPDIWSAGGYVDRWTGSSGSLHERVDTIDETTEVPLTAGAAFLVRQEVFRDIGLLDDDFFIYYEETEFCARARDAGWRVIYVPVEGVCHKETTDYSHNAFGDYYLVRNRLLYQQKTQPMHFRAVFYPYYIVRWIILQIGYLLLVERDFSVAKATLKGGLDAILGKTGQRHSEQDVY